MYSKIKCHVVLWFECRDRSVHVQPSSSECPLTVPMTSWAEECSIAGRVLSRSHQQTIIVVLVKKIRHPVDVSQQNCNNLFFTCRSYCDIVWWQIQLHCNRNVELCYEKYIVLSAEPDMIWFNKWNNMKQIKLSIVWSIIFTVHDRHDLPFRIVPSVELLVGT